MTSTYNDKLKLAIESFSIAKLEKEVLRKNYQYLTVSPLDKEHISKDNSNIRVIPLGVDLEFYKSKKKPKKKQLVFLGVMAYEPNNDAAIWFIRNIYPEIKIQIPDINFKIIGKGPSDDLIKIAKGDSSISVTGEVKEVISHLDESLIFVCPLRYGAGQKYKVLNAMAMSLPVITTSCGAEGIKAIDGNEIIIADDPKLFAEKTISLLKNPEELNSIAMNGHQLVSKEYSWNNCFKLLDRVVEKATHKT